jgi:hypothetical protein
MQPAIAGFLFYDPKTCAAAWRTWRQVRRDLSTSSDDRVPDGVAILQCLFQGLKLANNSLDRRVA